MLSRYNAVDIEHALHSAKSPPPFPPAIDRAAWQTVARTLGADQAATIMTQAEEVARGDIPALPASLYLEFKRTGRREGYEHPRSQRRARLGHLTLAECLEAKGRFLDPLLDGVWAICEESSWALPAHQHELADPEYPVIDLGAAMTALELAELDLLLGAALDSALRKRIRYEVNQRCLIPYLTRHDHWWLYNTHLRTVNNWTAVCNAGVVGAAIYLESDLVRLAEIIARAAGSLADYLATFDLDGGSSEGPGYWSYGFGYYTILAHLVEQRTGGSINFLVGEQIRKIAAYPLHTILSPGVYVNFSDCDANITYARSHLCFLAQRLGLPDLAAFAHQQPGKIRPGNLTWGLRDLFWQPAATAPEPFIASRHDWFGGMMWMLARYHPADPNGLVLAAKGGHNQEMHNQNDVGSFIVHLNGESLIADVGRGRYTRAYFGPERYDHLVNSSLGHSVPVPNGQLQQSGKEYAAELLEHRAVEHEDTLSLELKGVYPAATRLQSLHRRLTLYREPPRGWVELEDRFQFSNGPGTFESALTTFAQVVIGKDDVLIQGERGKLRLGFDPETVTVRVDVHPDVDLATGPANIRRIVFTFKEPAQEGRIRLQMVPQ